MAFPAALSETGWECPSVGCMGRPQKLLGALAITLLLVGACGDDDGGGGDGPAPAEADGSDADPGDPDSSSATDGDMEGSETQLSADTLRASLEQSGVEVESLTLDDGTATVTLPPGSEGSIDVVCLGTEPFVDAVVVVIDGEPQPCY